MRNDKRLNERRADCTGRGGIDFGGCGEMKKLYICKRIRFKKEYEHSY